VRRSGALPIVGADDRRDLGLHQLGDHRRHRLADHVDVL
jgi:hypothetical protein